MSLAGQFVHNTIFSPFRLIIKELDNITDMNLQHPELIPLLIATEPKLKENEWIDVKGLMSRFVQFLSRLSIWS